MPENINIPDSNITTELSFRNLILMNMQQLTNFPYIENDFDALTDYELLCLVVKYLNDVISNQNEQNASITRLYNSFLALQDYINDAKNEMEDAFNELDTYVRTFFANLDVQDEINNKLDAMVEDGTLPEIITNYLNTKAAFCYDNIASLKSATNLVDGSYARTLGYYSINDGGSAFYKIRTKIVTDVTNEGSLVSLSDNTLVAELIPTDTINVEVFGAKGDGVSDDTTYIQNACDYISTNKLVLQFLEKHYIITDTISINNDLVIKGITQKSEIEQTTNNKHIFANLTTIDNIHIDTLYLHGVTAPDSSGTEYEYSCLWLCGCTNSTFNNVKFGSSDDSQISLRYSVNGDDSLNYSENNKITNCEFTGCSEGSPIELFYAKKTLIDNCYFHDNNLNYTRWTIRMLQVDGADVYNSKFYNEYNTMMISCGHSPGNYPLVQSKNIKIKNCEFIYSRHSNIICKGTNVVIEDCLFDNGNNVIASEACIQLNFQNDNADIAQDVSNRCVRNCQFINFTTPILLYDHQTNIMIDSNRYYSDTTRERMYGVRCNNFTNCNYITIKNNTMYGIGCKLHMTRIDTDNASLICDIINNNLYMTESIPTYPLTYIASTSCYLGGNVVNHLSNNQ